MNKRIIKIFKLKIYIILIFLIIDKNTQNIYYILLYLFILLYSSWKIYLKNKKNMKYKEKDENKKNWKR